MGVIFRQSFKGSLATYVGVIIGYFNVVYLFPKYFSESELGILRFILEASVVLSTFALMGNQHAMIRFYPRLKSKENDRGFAFAAFFLPLIGFSIFTLVYYFAEEVFIIFFSKNASKLIEYYSLIVPFVFVAMMMLIVENYISIRNRITFTRVTREIGLRLILSIGAVFFGAKIMSFTQVVYLVLFLNFMVLALNVYYLLKLAPINLKPAFGVFDRKIRKDYFAYVGVILLGGITSVVLNRLDFIMISSMDGMASTGIYSTAFYIAMIIEVPRRAIQQIAAPVIAREIHDGNILEIKKIYSKTSINQTLVGVILFLAIWVNLDELFNWMPNGNVYKTGKYVFFFIGIGKIIELMSGVGNVIINNSNYYQYSLALNVVSTVIAIFGNILLIPRFGISGAAIATAFSMLLYSVYVIILVWWKEQIQPFNKSIIYVIVLLAAGLLADSLIKIQLENMILQVLLNTTIFVLPVALILYRLKISEDINSQILKLVSKFGK